jgi:glutamine synthetase
MDIKRIEKEIAETPGEMIRYAVCDIDGVLRGKYISKKKLLSGFQSGLGFCDVVFGWDMADTCYENNSFTGWHSAFPDKKAFPDWKTKRKTPWLENSLFLLADFSQETEFIPCPRTLLKNVEKKAEEMGFIVFAGQEFEWFNFKKENPSMPAHQQPPITNGMYGYSLPRLTSCQNYVDDLLRNLPNFNVNLEGFHTETGPGVYEAALEKNTLLKAGDQAVLFKSAIKEIAALHQIIPTFMAKWSGQYPGCSGHFHQSLWDLDKKENLFFSSERPYRMSEVMEHYIAGQLKCLPEVLPFYAPTINSYKRMVAGSWAPTTISWGIENRTTAIRMISGSKKSQRVELRVPGADCNPYLAMAASVASGLYGIENKLKLEDRTIANAYADPKLKELPNTLHQAVENLKNSQTAIDLFGEAFVKHFVESREWECQQFDNAVTSWESERYFEII